MQVKSSFSMVANLLSALTIGSMITCIVSVVIIVILSYQKNLLNKLDNDQDTEIPVETYVDFSSSSDMALELVLEGIILLEGIFYCLVNIVILRKWVRHQ